MTQTFLHNLNSQKKKVGKKRIKFIPVQQKKEKKWIVRVCKNHAETITLNCNLILHIAKFNWNIHRIEIQKQTKKQARGISHIFVRFGGPIIRRNLAILPIIQTKFQHNSVQLFRLHSKNRLHLATSTLLGPNKQTNEKVHKEIGNIYTPTQKPTRFIN